MGHWRGFFIKSFVSSLKLNFLTITVIFSVIFLSVGVFTVFRVLNARSLANSVSAIESILRNETNTSNPYSLAKSISDLETLGLLNCVVLRESSEGNHIFFDSRPRSSCLIDRSSFMRGLHPFIETEVIAVNGMVYQLKMQAPIQWSELMLEVFLYGFLVSSGFAIEILRRRTESVNQWKLKAAHAERAILLDSTRQIRHDVASPLTAIRFISAALKDVDPEKKEILLKAVDRADEIFAELAEAARTDKAGKVDLMLVLKDVLDEKRSVWGSDVTFEYVGLDKNEVSVVAEVSALKRVLSNLLNNGYEARRLDHQTHFRIEVEESDQHISLKLIDNGKGIPEEVLSKLGVAKVTHGKSGSKTAGNGIGVYSAAQKIRAWAGDIKFRSQLGVGSEVELSLLKNF